MAPPRPQLHAADRLRGRVGGVVAEPHPSQNRACGHCRTRLLAWQVRTASVAIRARCVDTIPKLGVFSCFPPPALPRDAPLPSGGSRRPRFPAFSGTISALRLPVPHPLGLLVRRPVPHASCLVRVRSRAPGIVQARRRAGVLIGQAGLPPSSLSARGRNRASQVPRQPISQLCSVPATPAGPSRLAKAALPVLPLPCTSTKAPAIVLISGFNSTASLPAVYASRRPLPDAMQHSLPAGWLAFAGRGSHPLGCDARLQFLMAPPFSNLPLARALPGATCIRFRFHAAHASRHSNPAAAWPRIENCRKPSASLTAPNTVSTVALRLAQTALPSAVFMPHPHRIGPGRADGAVQRAVVPLPALGHRRLDPRRLARLVCRDRIIRPTEIVIPDIAPEGAQLAAVQQFVRMLHVELPPRLAQTARWFNDKDAIPKVIVRADDLDTLELLQSEIDRVFETQSVLVHDRAKKTVQSLDRFTSVSSATRACEDAQFWLHQSKLMEGIDDPCFVAVAIFDLMGNARQLVQQIGRATRYSKGERRLPQTG